jgi:hypothetical protein
MSIPGEELHTEPFGHLLTPRHITRAQDRGLGPGAEKLVYPLEHLGMLAVNQRGKPFRLVVDGSHTLVLQVNVIDDLDAQNRNDEEEDEQHKALSKTHAPSIDAKDAQLTKADLRRFIKGRDE